MIRNLESTHGLLLAEAVSSALSEHLGRPAAHRLVEEASHRAMQEKRSLQSVLAEMPAVMQHLTPSALHKLFD